jgi:hypothetical protein
MEMKNACLLKIFVRKSEEKKPLRRLRLGGNMVYFCGLVYDPVSS